MTVADHIQKVLKPNFGAAWEEVGDEFEKEETFALASVRTLDGTEKSNTFYTFSKNSKIKVIAALSVNLSLTEFSAVTSSCK